MLGIEKKVYLHDTDSTDIVYYSKYLEWFEEARVDYIAKVYKPLTQLIEEDKISFLPVRVEVDYKKPLKFEDECYITVKIKELTKIKIVLEYSVGSESLNALGIVEMLCISTETKKPAKIPINLMSILLEEKESNHI